MVTGELELTRHALELIDAYNCGVAIATKGDLIARDIDILRSIRAHSPVVCKLTVTTADDALAAKIEPNATGPTPAGTHLGLSSAGALGRALAWTGCSPSFSGTGLSMAPKPVAMTVTRSSSSSVSSKAVPARRCSPSPT